MWLFSRRKGASNGDGNRPPKKSREQTESPIQRMMRRMKENGGDWVDQATANLNQIILENAEADPDEMSEDEKSRITKALFPRTLSMLKELKDTLVKGESPFPASLDMVAPGTPTMDDVTGTTGGNPKGASIGRGLPNAIGRGMVPESKAIGNRGQYPQYGKNAAIESNGLSMMPDPLNRFPINPRVLKHFQSRVWITYSGCAIIATHEFVSRACTIPAEDAMAHGYKVICVSHDHNHTQEHDEKEEQFLKEIKKAADIMGLNEACIKLNYKKKVFGVGVAIPKVEFRDDYYSPTDKNGKTPYSYADEFDVKAIKPKSFKGFAVVDPHWLTYKWDDESATDPTSPHFLEPTWIEVGAKKIHRSWCIRVINSEIPDILKPAYYYGGLSLTQMIYERVWAADKLANEAPLLAMTKRLLVADGNLEQMISDARHTNIFFKAINYFRDNFSIFVKKPSSNVTQLDTNLSELTQLTMSQYQLVAAIAQIPVTKLLKNVPTGLQSTGDYEWDDYAQSLHAIQDHDYTPLCRKFYELYVASEYPDKRDIHLDIEWNPIDVPKEKELAQMSSQTAQYVAHLLQTHVITVAEARSMLRKSDLPAFQTIPMPIPKILEKIEEASDPAKQQGGGMPGIGGGGAIPPPEGDEGKNKGGQPVTDPETIKNDQIFKDVLKKVTGESLENGVPPDAEPNPEQNEESPQEEPQAEEEAQTRVIQNLEGQPHPEQEQEGKGHESDAEGESEQR